MKSDFIKQHGELQLLYYSDQNEVQLKLNQCCKQNVMAESNKQPRSGQSGEFPVGRLAVVPVRNRIISQA